MSDPYIDPQSGILRNRFGLADQESLDRAEANAVSIHSILLQLNPLKGNFDSEHLKAIHSYLFQAFRTGEIPDDPNLSLRSGCSTEPLLMQPPLQYKALMELTRVRQNTRDLKRS